ncbi:hypothetical protein DSO57_1008181 [Entomophthora muscae]|uniref:Uncharacterized protein n=1 Tax=Entomophthora muscae TaxID=34485 RepID=A0ACC2U5F4_9FUNG|nr:hypothetical protein DSO57_1008181 [Entomophthora muscae]
MKKASKRDTSSTKPTSNHQVYRRLLKEKQNFQLANLKGTLVALKETDAPDPKPWIAVVVEFLEEKLNQTSEQSVHVKEVLNYLTCTLKNLDSSSTPCFIRPLSDQAKCLIRYLVNRLHPKATENEFRFRHVSRRIADQCIPLLHKQLSDTIGPLKKVNAQNTSQFIPIFYRPEFNPLNIAPAYISCMSKSLKKESL